MIGSADVSIRLYGQASENRLAFCGKSYRVFKLISDHS